MPLGLFSPQRYPKLSRRVGQSVDDAIDDLLNQNLVFSLSHDANHGFGARRADDQPAMNIQTSFSKLDGGSHLRVFQRLAALVAHVLEDLRQRVEPVTYR